MVEFDGLDGEGVAEERDDLVFHEFVVVEAMDAIAPLRAAAESRGSTDFTPFWAGQASPLGREISAELLTASLVKEASERFRQLRC